MLNNEEESQEELEALIEHEKKNIHFYVIFYEELETKLSPRQIEMLIDFHLDRLIILLRRRKF